MEAFDVGGLSKRNRKRPGQVFDNSDQHKIKRNQGG